MKNHKCIKSHPPYDYKQVISIKPFKEELPNTSTKKIQLNKNNAK